MLTDQVNHEFHVLEFEIHLERAVSQVYSLAENRVSLALRRQPELARMLSADSI